MTRSVKTAQIQTLLVPNTDTYFNDSRTLRTMAS